MYSKNDLKEQLIQMGLKKDDSVMIHSSMKQIGEVEDKADGVIDVLMDYFSEGLLMLPTHSWAYMDENNTLFDVNNQESNIGILTNIFRKRPNVYRSYHPTHSVAAFGKNAKEYIKNEENSLTPCSVNGLWGRLPSINAKIMLVGCNHGRNTFIHAIEEMMDVPNRFYDKPILFQIKDNDKIMERPFYKHHTKGMPSLSDNFSKAEELLKDKGVVTYHKFGNATVLLMDASKLADFIKQMLLIDINVFSTREELDREKYEHLKIK